MTGKRTLLSLRQLQPSLVSGGKILLTLLHPPQKKTVEISLLYVHQVYLSAELIVQDAAITIHVATYDGQPEIVAAVCSVAATILHSITVGEFLDAAPSRHVRAATIPFCRVVH